MSLPSFSALRMHDCAVTGVVSDNRSKDILQRLKMWEAISGREIQHKPFGNAVVWTDGDESRAEDSTNVSPPLLLVLRESEKSVEVKSTDRIGKFSIEWGNINTVLDALLAFYTTCTPFWKDRVWGSMAPSPGANQFYAARALVSAHDSSLKECTDPKEVLKSISRYQNSSYNCITLAQRGDDGECLGRSLEEWRKDVHNIGSMMIDIDQDIFVGSVDETGICKRTGEFMLEQFVSTTINFRALDKGAFDSLRHGEVPTFLALRLLPGTRVMPLFAVEGLDAKRWELEVLIDANQWMEVEDVCSVLLYDGRGTQSRRVVTASVRPS